MRKVLLLILGVIALGSVQAQHLIFKGIPIDGPIDNFVEKLKQQGYTLKKTFEDNSVLMEGTFANNECELFVLPTPTSETVWKVAVFNKKKYQTWSSIERDYNELKDLYTKKYGKPSRDYHFFSYPYERGDSYEMTALKNEKCHYLVSYELLDGFITVSMSTSCQLLQSYEDAINSKLDSKESEETALGDI